MIEVFDNPPIVVLESENTDASRRSLWTRQFLSFNLNAIEK
jgi:hypothetical protein